MNPRLLECCRRLLATPSVTSDGTRRIAEVCAAEILAPAGIRARLLPSIHEGSEQVNLLATIPGRDQTAVPLVLNAHLDTVAPGDRTLWTVCAGDPFNPTVVEDRIYGLGAADTKLDFVAKATALIECGGPRRTTYLVGTFGEEHGLVGAKEMIESALLPPGALTFVGEPSGLKLITAHKELIVFELQLGFQPQRMNGSATASKAVFIGRAAHSSTPALGLNAIRAALAAAAARPELKIVAIAGGDAINKVAARCEVLRVRDSAQALAGASRIERVTESSNEFIPAQAIAATARFIEALDEFADRIGPPENDFGAPTLTCNVGVIRTERERIRLEFELRPPPSLSLDDVRNGLRSLVAALARGTTGVEFALTERRANPGFRCALDSETVECAMAALAQAGLPLETDVKAGCTEAGIYASAGLRPVVIGPGPSTGVIHAPNEYNCLLEVEAAVRFYKALLEV